MGKKRGYSAFYRNFYIRINNHVISIHFLNSIYKNVANNQKPLGLLFKNFNLIVRINNQPTIQTKYVHKVSKYMFKLCFN